MRRTGLVLVLPLDLEDVEEVGRRGVDLDEVLVRLWCWLREVFHHELLGALHLVNMSHFPEGSVELTAVISHEIRTYLDIFLDLNSTHLEGFNGISARAKRSR